MIAIQARQQQGEEGRTPKGSSAERTGRQGWSQRVLGGQAAGTGTVPAPWVQRSPLPFPAAPKS